MVHFIHFLKSIIMTAAITLLPILIFTGGSLPPVIMNNPLYHFFVVAVFGYAMAPVIADFAGDHIGRSLFHPNRANVDKPTMSHIISLRNKRLYKEAMEELRMLNERFPNEIEPYKMLLHLSAHELPDRSLFDLTFRKALRNLESEEQKNTIKRYREEHIQHKEDLDEEWAETSHIDEQHSKEFSANRKHHRNVNKHTLHISKHSVEVPQSRTHIEKERVKGIIHEKAKGNSVANVEEKYTPPTDEKNFGASRSNLDKSLPRKKSYRFVRKRSGGSSSIHNARH